MLMQDKHYPKIRLSLIRDKYAKITLGGVMEHYELKPCWPDVCVCIIRLPRFIIIKILVYAMVNRFVFGPVFYIYVELNCNYIPSLYCM